MAELSREQPPRELPSEYIEGTTVRAAGNRAINPKLVLTALMLVIASFQLNATMLAPAIGDMASALNTNAGVIGWSSTVFLAVAAALAIFFPPLADKIGRRVTLLISVSFMVVGTGLVLVTSSVAMLMVGRFLQGFCGATFALGNLTLRAILHPKKYGFYIGLVAAINSGVAGIDTLLGGVIVDHAGYKGIFWTILALEVLALICVVAWVPETRVPAASRMDWGGAMTLTGSLWSANMALTFGFGSLGWGNTWTIAAIIAAVVLAVAFVLVERGVSDPLVPLNELVKRQTWGVTGTAFFTLASAFSVLMYLIPAVSQDAQNGLGMGGTESALLYLTPFSLLGWLLAPFVGKYAPRLGYRAILRAGLLGSIVLITGVVVFGFENRWVLFTLAFLMGATYTAMSNTTLNAMGVLYASPTRPGVLPGLTSAAFNLGAGVGTGVMASFVARNAVAGDITAGYSQAAIVGLVCAVIAFAISLALPAQETTGGEKI